jgi:hypothetical protein
MPVPSGCGIMHLNTSLPARGMDVRSRNTGHPLAPPQVLTDCYKGDKMLALSVTTREVIDPQVEEEEVGDVLPPMALR